MSALKKALIFILLTALILSSCGKGDTEAVEDGYHFFNYNYQGCFSYDNGEIYSDNIGRLHYTDFETMNSVFICPKPNCPHTDSEVCSSYGMSGTVGQGCTVVYNDRIYFHCDNNHYDKNGELVVETDVYSAALDGTDRRKEGVIEDQHAFPNAIYGEGKLYFHYPKELESGKSESYIRCYDYKSGSVREYGPIIEEYDTDAMFCGECGGELYIMLFYRTEETIVDENTVYDDKYIEHLNSISRVAYKKLNLSTGEITDWAIPERIKTANNMDIYTTIKDGYFIYSDSKSTLAVTPDGEEYFFDGYDACNIAVLNDMVFPYLIYGENKAIDLKTGKLVTVKLNEKCGKWGAYVCGYYDDQYILRFHDDAKWFAYKKVDLEAVR